MIYGLSYDVDLKSRRCSLQIHGQIIINKSISAKRIVLMHSSLGIPDHSHGN